MHSFVDTFVLSAPTNFPAYLLTSWNMTGAEQHNHHNGHCLAMILPTLIALRICERAKHHQFSPYMTSKLIISKGCQKPSLCIPVFPYGLACTCNPLLLSPPKDKCYEYLCVRFCLLLLPFPFTNKFLGWI